MTVTRPCCPSCGKIITKDEKGNVASLYWLKQRQRQCRHCGQALWQDGRRHSAPAEGEKYPKRDPRYPLAQLLRKRYRRQVGLVIFDESHEYKNAGSDRGRAMQDLVLTADYALAMTGTLFDGKASTLFDTEWAFNPRWMQRHYPISNGREAGLNRWVKAMGVLERVVEYKESKGLDGRTSGTTRHERKPQEAPGISPALLPTLLNHTIWLKISDLNLPMPVYREVAIPVDLPQDVAAEYRRVEGVLTRHLIACKTRQDGSFLSTYLQTLLRYPTACFREREVRHRDPIRTDDEDNPLIHQITDAKGFGEERLYPKEEALLDLLNTEIPASRPCVVFVAQTGKYDIQPRLKKLIEVHVPSAKPFILRAGDTGGREAWIDKQVEAGGNVMICNLKLVRTGLDLVWAKHLIHYEIEYSLNDVRQASRRHWRPTADLDEECLVSFLYYVETMEERAIELVSEKAKAADLLDGNQASGLAKVAGKQSLLSLLAETVGYEAEKRKPGDPISGTMMTAGGAEGGDSRSPWLSHAPPIRKLVGTKSLENVIGQCWSEAGQRWTIADYGPLTDATYLIQDRDGKQEVKTAEEVLRLLKSHPAPDLMSNKEEMVQPTLLLTPEETALKTMEKLKDVPEEVLPASHTAMDKASEQYYRLWQKLKATVPADILLLVEEADGSLSSYESDAEQIATALETNPLRQKLKDTMVITLSIRKSYKAKTLDLLTKQKLKVMVAEKKPAVAEKKPAVAVSKP
ncbi:MAG: hypothetical protein OEY28_11975, partial [Nitrospira sp.]|nr:hypothetical protein [Nitrospira sp.]